MVCGRPVDADRPSAGYRRYWSGAAAIAWAISVSHRTTCVVGHRVGRRRDGEVLHPGGPLERSEVHEGGLVDVTVLGDVLRRDEDDVGIRGTGDREVLERDREGAISVVEEGDRSVGAAVDLVEGAAGHRRGGGRRRAVLHHHARFGRRAVLHHRARLGRRAVLHHGRLGRRGRHTPRRGASGGHQNRRQDDATERGGRAAWTGHRCLLNTCTGFGQPSLSIARDNRMTRDIDPSPARLASRAMARFGTSIRRNAMHPPASTPRARLMRPAALALAGAAAGALAIARLRAVRRIGRRRTLAHHRGGDGRHQPPAAGREGGLRRPLRHERQAGPQRPGRRRRGR